MTTETTPMTPEQIASHAITEQDGFDFLFKEGFISRHQHECATAKPTPRERAAKQLMEAIMLISENPSSSTEHKIDACEKAVVAIMNAKAHEDLAAMKSIL